MDKHYRPEQTEEKVYHFWEKGGWFTPKIDEKKKPFSILLPPPNANDPLHAGHALYVVEDILCRWHRMMGNPTLFLPGTDHAGIETQFVFEKKLSKEGKSRFDFDRNTLYGLINDYVEENRGIAKNQLKRMGFSLDWTRERYTLDKNILATVLETFKKLHQDGLVYRDERIVNFCPHCGTAFSELEVEYIDKDDYLYFLDYGPITIATTRPETIFADVAVAVNPKDKRYKKFAGKQAKLPITGREVPIITDELVDIKFGTGALKITPAHDKTDFEIGQKHKLAIIKVIDTNGRLINVPKKYLGMKASQARQIVIADLEKEGKLVKKTPLKHSVGICYRCKRNIEPLTMPQWFVKVAPLAKKAVEAVKSGKVKIVPKRFEKLYFNWMDNIEDWNISRQIVWGPRIPAWYCLDCNPNILITFIAKNGKKITDKYENLKTVNFDEIKNGLQSIVVPVESDYFVEHKTTCPKCQGKHILQETDTFDTWFSSGQWPITTLGFPDSKDFKYFYPTSVLDTMWDILFFWVARMIMLCLYRTNKVPFEVAHMHSRVVDAKGQKMSKSKGNVINPLKMVEKYGADALRMALVYGVAPASDIALSEDKIRSMRNFCNKIWNASRFVIMDLPDGLEIKLKSVKNKDDKQIIDKLKLLHKKVSLQLEKYRFGQALEEIYQFFWHDFCDDYIEKVKNRKLEAIPVLLAVLVSSLKLIHPFAPFLTEEIYQSLTKEKKIKNLKESLVIENWQTKLL